MGTRSLVAILLLATSLISIVGPAEAGPPSWADAHVPSSPGPHVPGELLVAPADGVSEVDLEWTYKGHGGGLIKKLSSIGVHHISVPAAALDAVEAALQHNPNVKFVEKNFLVQEAATPNDPLYGSQWHLAKTFASAGWDISKGSSSVPIAILDSGVDTSHPDLAAKLLPGWNFVSGNGAIVDNTGHGTAVTGTAAAITNDALGVAGLAWLNPVMPLVVADSSGYATYANIASAVTYAADHGANVISMSLAGPSYSSTLQSAVNYAWNKGLVLVAAAGNASTNAPYYPAALTNVVAVSATDQYDQKASFSNYGSWIDVAAPGTYIYTTTSGGGYGAWQGTSFSTPQVSALAALVFSTNPGLTNAQVVNLLKSSADDLGTGGFDDYFGWGRIDVVRTLQAALSTSPGPTDTTAPTVAITTPSGGSAVSGTVMVQASASDNVGVTKVDFYVDSVLQATDSSASYSFSWNTTGLSGSHTLVAVASDAAGKSTSSAPVAVTVSPSSGDTTPPTVAITSLVYDGRFLTVTTSASDSGSGVVQVELLVDGIVKATDAGTPWSFRLNTRKLPTGSHTVQARAYDAAGNTALSASQTFTK